MISDLIDNEIVNAIRRFDGIYTLVPEDCFRELLSLGELVDRLSIVNFKLYTLKEKQKSSRDADFLAFAAKEDVKLVEERARLKRCIDRKVLAYIEEQDKFNPEVKTYGDKL